MDELDERKESDDKSRYRHAWEYHIDELALLALRANISYDEYRDVKATLNTWLNKALERK